MRKSKQKQDIEERIDNSANSESLHDWLKRKYHMSYRAFQRKSKERKDGLRLEYIDDTGNEIPGFDPIRAVYEIDDETYAKIEDYAASMGISPRAYIMLSLLQHEAYDDEECELGSDCVTNWMEWKSGVYKDISAFDRIAFTQLQELEDKGYLHVQDVEPFFTGQEEIVGRWDIYDSPAENPYFRRVTGNLIHMPTGGFQRFREAQGTQSGKPLRNEIIQFSDLQR